MPLFGSNVISSLQARFDEANYELGRFVQDTKSYLSRQSHSLGKIKVPKSQSVPAFPQSRSFIFGKGSSDLDDKPQGKFVYRSSLRPPSEEDILGCEDIAEEDIGVSIADSTVVEKFIKVIEASSKEIGKGSGKTREDIRKKLAFAPQSESLSAKRADLEICFINEIVDEDIVETDSPQSLPTSVLPRSKSECVSIFKQSHHAKECTDYTSVAYKLAKCTKDAQRKMMIEKQNRKFHEVNSFNQLIGKSIEGDLNQEVLSQMNTATLQVIVNDFHNKIEKLNEDLVKELMRKDELQIEQDGQMVDIDDLRQTLNRN